MKRFFEGATSTTDVSVASSRKNYTNVINNATLSIVALFVAFVLAGGTANAQTFSGGDGLTELTAYEIANAGDFQELDDFVSGTVSNFNPLGTITSFANMHLKVMSPIILNNIIVGDAYHPFCGHIDGDNQTITLNLNFPTIDRVGLFATLGDGAFIENVILQAAITGANDVGGIAAFANADIIIMNCVLHGSISGQNTVGGIAGYITTPINSTQPSGITECTNYANISATISTIGGIAGEGNCFIGYCYNAGNVVGVSSSSGSGFPTDIFGINAALHLNTTVLPPSNADNVGGILGVCNSSNGGVTSNRNVDYCTNIGIVYGHKNVGGIVGSHVSTVKTDINAGVVIGYDDFVGGICGFYDGHHFMSNRNYAPINVVNGLATNIGGIAGYIGNNLPGDTVTDCIYDNQMCTLMNNGNIKNKRVQSFPTLQMLGNQVSAPFPYASSDLYPRIGNTVIDYVAAAPIVLNGSDTYDNVKNAFSLNGGTAPNMVDWTDNAGILATGAAAVKTVATNNATGEFLFTATLGGTMKRIPLYFADQWKKISVTNQTTAFTIGAVTPMPVRDNANLTITAHQDGKLNAKLYNLSGIEVANLMDTDAQTNSNYNLNLNAGNLASGTYMLIVSLGDEIASRQIVVNE